MNGIHYNYQDLLDNVLMIITQDEHLGKSINIALHQLKDAVERHQPQETINAYVRQAMFLSEGRKYRSLKSYFKQYLEGQVRNGFN